MKSWWSRNPGIVKINCIPFTDFEPYLLWHHDESSLYFDDRFFDYGYNKISHMNSLRMRGFHFGTLSGVFAFDLPHKPYKYLLFT